MMPLGETDLFFDTLTCGGGVDGGVDGSGCDVEGGGGYHTSLTIKNS